MKKSEALNTFTSGLVMDINPLVAPNDGVCNALNATLITMNGNENVLQNDMGNGRVETAYLPEGYVPLGTTELGGIIYIVSYNPLNKKCQIGSFPSPERNISSDKINDNIQTLSNNDFNYNESIGSLVYYIKKELNQELIFNPGDKFIVYGDTISDNINNLYDDSVYNATNIKKALKQTVKLSIGTITNSGKLVKFDDLKLKQYKIKYTTGDTTEEKNYHILQYEHEDGQEPDLDEYRSLVEQPYNVFSSKVSGTLVLIAELVQFNDFDVYLKHNFIIPKNNGSESYSESRLESDSENNQENNQESDLKKEYDPTAMFTFSGDYPFIPKGVQGKLYLSGDGIEEPLEEDFKYNIDTNTDTDPDNPNKIINQIEQNNTSYEITDINIINNNIENQNTIKNKIKELANQGYFNKKERNGNYILKYTFTPCMNWGPIQHLQVNGQIDLDKIGTGYIGLNTWKYFNEPDKINLTWGLEIYEEEGHYVDNVKIEFTRIVSCTDSETTTETDADSETTTETKINTETVTYQVNKKQSYFGIFYDTIPIDQDFYKLQGGQLKSNCLYLTKVIVRYSSINNPDIGVNKEFYRWLYTNKVFNSYYGNTNDFQGLTLNLSPDVKLSYDTSITETDKVKVYGDLSKTAEELENNNDKINKYKDDTASSLSAIQTTKIASIDCNLQVGLKKDYDTFDLQVNEGAFNIDLIGSESSSKADILYTDVEDKDQEKYLKSESIIVDDFDNYKINQETDLSTIPTLVSKSAMLPQSINPSSSTKFENNIYTLQIGSTLLQTVKAYCTRKIIDATYQGHYIPLAYDEETFYKYNLQWKDSSYFESGDGQWFPIIIGTFGFQYGNTGRVYVGSYDIDTHNYQYDCCLNQDHSKYPLNWTKNPVMAEMEKRLGWSNTAMFYIHDHGGHGSYNDDNDEIGVGSFLLNKNYKTSTNGEGIPMNNHKIYSNPSQRNQNLNRIQLSLASNYDDYFHPINCSVCGTNKKFSNIDTRPTLQDPHIDVIAKQIQFRGIFHKFAQWLHSIYRYDEGSVYQKIIVPDNILYMDNCEYKLQNKLQVKSTEEFKTNYSLNIKLEKGTKINLKDIIGELKKVGILAEGNYPTLDYNIDSSKSIESTESSTYDHTYTIEVISRDKFTGDDLRDHIFQYSNLSTKSAIIDYDGKSIVGTANIPTNKKALFERETSSVDSKIIHSIKLAEEFRPKDIIYNNGKFSSVGSGSTGESGEKEIGDIGSIETGGTEIGDIVTEGTEEIGPEELKPAKSIKPILPGIIKKISLNLNKYFTLNNDNLIVLKDPKQSEHEFYRCDNTTIISSSGTSLFSSIGTADGYLKVCILPDYKSY